MGGCLHGWLFAWVVVCMGGCLHGWLFAWVVVCMGGCLHGWLFAWVVVCMGGCLVIATYIAKIRNNHQKWRMFSESCSILCFLDLL